MNSAAVLCMPGHICLCSFYLWERILEVFQSHYPSSTWDGCNLRIHLCCPVGLCPKWRPRWTSQCHPCHTMTNFLCSPSGFLPSSSSSCQSRCHFWSHHSNTSALWYCLWPEAPSPDCNTFASSAPRTPFDWLNLILIIFHVALRKHITNRFISKEVSFTTWLHPYTKVLWLCNLTNIIGFNLFFCQYSRMRWLALHFKCYTF